MDGFGGTGGKKRKRVFLFFLFPFLTSKKKKKKARTPFPSTFHSLVISTEVSWSALPSSNSALSPPQLNTHSLSPPSTKAKHTPNPKRSSCFPPPPVSGIRAVVVTPIAASVGSPFWCSSAWVETSITPVNELFLSLPRCQCHVHVPCLAAGADTVTKSPPVLPHRTPRSLLHPFPAPGAGGTAGLAAGIAPGRHQRPSSPAASHHAGMARSRERWLPGWAQRAQHSSWHWWPSGTGDVECVCTRLHPSASTGWGAVRCFLLLAWGGLRG